MKLRSHDNLKFDKIGRKPRTV